MDVGSDDDIDYYNSEILSSTDYYAFGSLMPGRVFNPGTTKYGFNGKREDEEIYGEGNAYDFGARMYDPRIGRWLSVDPKASKLPSYTPYSFAVNSPILMVDPSRR